MSLWGSLPEEIVEEVVKEVVFLSDLVRFGMVCKAWYAIFLRQKRRRIERYSNEVPMLFIPPAPTPTTLSCSRGVKLLPNQMFHMLEYKCYNSQATLTPFSRILSASYGWLAAIIQEKPRHLTINLKNPITGNTISLPPVDSYSVWSISEVVLSCNPGNNNNNNNNKCVVAYSRDSDIGFIRLGEKTWNNFTMVAPRKRIEAMLFRNGELYVLDSFKDLFAIRCHWDGDKCYFQSYHIVQMTDSQPCREFKLYLVESLRGELLKIEKNKDTGYTIHMSDIMVHKLVISPDDGDENSKGHWVRIHQFGNGGEVLFLSACNAICSKSRSLQPGSVYVFDTYTISGYEIRRIISLKEKRTPRENYICVTFTRSPSKDFQPVWINPTLQ